jgi:hypothetical protein
MWRSLVAGFLLAGVLVGCGGSGAGGSGEGAGGGDGSRLSRRGYERAVAQIVESRPVRQAERLFSRLAAGDVTAAECRAETGRFVRDVGSGIDAVANLNPPAEVAGLHARFLIAARGTERKLRRLAEDVSAGNVRCGPQWNSRAYGLPSTDRAVTILAEYARRGYRIAINGE